MKHRYWQKLIVTLTLMVSLQPILNSSVQAATVTLSSGLQFDLSRAQIEEMKDAPGIYFLDYPPERFLKSDPDQWEIIQLPPDLGGGFLLAPEQSMRRALKRVGAKPPEVKAPPEPIAILSDNSLRFKRSRFDARLSLNAGLRRDDFDWNVAGDSSGSNPNVRTEVTWDDLTIFQIGTDFRADFRRKFHLRAGLAYGKILDGSSRQSDYLGDDRSSEFSRVTAASDDDRTLDAQIGFGYHFSFSNDRIGLTPLIGYAYNSQRLKMTDGFQVISDFGFSVPVGPLPGLNNTYETGWRGPWLGLDLVFRPKLSPDAETGLQIALGLAYHWTDYSAEGNWNLHTNLGQPTQFDHDAEGNGVDVTASVEWMIKKNWGVDFGFVYRNRHAANGTEKARFSNGSTIERQLNDVNWQSYLLGVGVKYRF